MSAPTKARKRSTRSAVQIDRATEQKERVERLITVDQVEAIKALTEALGQAHQTIAVNGVLINRLVNHILAIDPDDTLAQQVQRALEEEEQS